MKYFIKTLLLIGICASGVSAQVIREFVDVPRDVILQMIAVQPNCPVRFEDVRFLAALVGGSTNSYELRNVGTKPVRSVTVASSRGDKNSYANDGKVLIMPGELMKEPIGCPDCVKDKIVPLTAELREKLNIKNQMKGVMILMVVEVEFMDGTKYSDEKTYNAMTEYMDNLDVALREQKQRAVKKP